MGIDALVTAQQEFSAPDEIRLRTLGVYNTKVTPAGVRRILGKAPGVLGVPSVLGGRIEMAFYLLEEESSLASMMSASYRAEQERARQQWRAVSADFPYVRFASWRAGR